MATFAFVNASVTINSVDLSDHVKSVSLTVEGDELDDTAMGDTYRSRIGGLKDWSVDIEFNQDHAASEVDATLFPLIGTTTTVAVKPVNTTTSATNPSYNGTAFLASYSPMDGSVGDLAAATVSFVGAGTLSRSTS